MARNRGCCLTIGPSYHWVLHHCNYLGHPPCCQGSHWRTNRLHLCGSHWDGERVLKDHRRKKCHFRLKHKKTIIFCLIGSMIKYLFLRDSQKILFILQTGHTIPAIISIDLTIGISCTWFSITLHCSKTSARYSKFQVE